VRPRVQIPGARQYIRLSLSDIALSIAGHLGFLAEAQLNLEPRPRVGNDLYGSYGRDFRTSDGRYVIAVALTPDQWRNLVKATDKAPEVLRLEEEFGVDLREEGARYKLRKQIGEMLEPWVAARSLNEVRKVFDSHHVLWGPYQTFKELVAADPRCSVANPLFSEVNQPRIGTYLRAGSPLVFGGVERREAQRSPQLGEHTEDVLTSWLGIDSTEIARLAERGVIRSI
jgi:2-methylfumaryl-CoA isomerase